MSVDINADFTPTLGSYRELRPFRFWCQKVLPLVYDDSLSYYELLAKVVDYLNKTMEDVDTLHGDVENLHDAYVQLQDYVNSYFDSLDVQEEINNKLDDMARDGSLGATVAPFIPATVTEWMDANISPSTGVVDASLRVEKASADSQIVGARFAGLENNSMFDFSVWIQGLWNTSSGIAQNNSKWVRTPLYSIDNILAKTGYIITNPDGYQVDVIYFDEMRSVLTYRRTTDTILSTFVPTNTKYIGINVHTTDNTEISPADMPDVNIYALPNYNIRQTKLSLETQNQTNEPITFDEWLDIGAFISADNGRINNSSNFRTCPKVFKPEPNALYFTNNEDEDVRIACYDADFILVGVVRITTATHPVIPNTIPENTVYGFLFASAGASDIVLDCLRDIDVPCVEAPFTESDSSYLFFPNKIMYEDGRITSTINYSVILMKVKEGQKVYQSINRATTAVMWDNGNGSLLSYEQLSPTGRVYTIPADGYIGMNVRTADVDAVTGLCPEYVTIADGNAKRVLAIGDSLTWLDGRGTYGESLSMVGWQAVLRKNGYIVQSRGYSGHPYANATVEGENVGIARSIIDSNYDVTSYDIVVLFGGTNDVRMNIPFGVETTGYESPNLDMTTFVGAIGALVNYIRTNNPNAVIYIMDMIPSTLESRDYESMNNYIERIYSCAGYWGMRVITSFMGIDVSPANETSFTEFYYDTTHLNIKGMKRLGEFVLKEIGK